VIKGKRLIVVDDSIVRGNTQRALVSMLREAGAAEVHVRISSPPITWPCFYGIDFASRAELIATGLGVDEVRQAIGADSLGYLSPEGMIAATEQPRDRLCTACFTGVYPIPLPDALHLGKNLLERTAPAGSTDSTRSTASAGSPVVASDASVAAAEASRTSDGCDPGPDAEYEPLLDPASMRASTRPTTRGTQGQFMIGDPGRQE